HELRRAEATHHHVGRLEVAVHDSLRVRERNDLADSMHHEQSSVETPAVLSLACEAEDLAETAPRHETHREVGMPFTVFAQLVDRDDAGVIELTGDLRLFDESAELLVVETLLLLVGGRIDDVLAKHLHGDFSLELRIE